MNEAIKAAKFRLEYRHGQIGGTWSAEPGDYFDTAAEAFAMLTPEYRRHWSDFDFRVMQGDKRITEKFEADGWTTEHPKLKSTDVEVDSKIAAAAAKLPLDMISLSSISGASRVKQFGARKHGHGNYMSATDDAAPQRYIGGVLRHIAALQAPGGKYTFESLTALDGESGLPEIDHAICGLLMLRDIATKRGVLKQDPGQGRSMEEAASYAMGKAPQ